MPSIMIKFIAILFVVTNILVLLPAKAAQAPTELTKQLINEGCIIPTEIIKLGDYTVKYIISGEFAHAGQKDFAAICLKNNKTYLRIIWGGKYQCDSKIESYGQAIDIAKKEYILSHYVANRSAALPEITHHGIEDIVLEKASTIRYCHKGKWLELSGAD